MEVREEGEGVRCVYDDEMEEWLALPRERFQWLAPRAQSAGGGAALQVRLEGALLPRPKQASIVCFDQRLVFCHLSPPAERRAAGVAPGCSPHRPFIGFNCMSWPGEGRVALEWCSQQDKAGMEEAEDIPPDACVAGCEAREAVLGHAARKPADAG